MVHEGYEDYFFWKGVLYAQIYGLSNLEERLRSLCALDTKVVETCREAFSWGAAFGDQITEMEYILLISEVKPARIVYSKKEKLDNSSTADIIKDDELDKEYPVKGNC